MVVRVTVRRRDLPAFKEALLKAVQDATVKSAEEAKEVLFSFVDAGWHPYSPSYAAKKKVPLNSTPDLALTWRMRNGIRVITKDNGAIVETPSPSRVHEVGARTGSPHHFKIDWPGWGEGPKQRPGLQNTEDQVHYMPARPWATNPLIGYHDIVTRNVEKAVKSLEGDFNK